MQEPLGMIAIERALLGQKQCVRESRARISRRAMRPWSTHGGVNIAHRQKPGEWADGGCFQAGWVAGAVEPLVMPVGRFDQPSRTCRQSSDQLGPDASMSLNDSFLFDGQRFLLNQDRRRNPKHAGVMKQGRQDRFDQPAVPFHRWLNYPSHHMGYDQTVASDEPTDPMGVPGIMAAAQRFGIRNRRLRLIGLWQGALNVKRIMETKGRGLPRFPNDRFRDLP